ncbi:MAG TPA: metal-binding protein, partial [Roseiflexaceae bacterium]|nr:metal-binding protein [Roseiflexaceae bacterium]
MPGARTHDIITLISGAALVPPAYAALAAADPAGAAGGVAWLVGAHLLSGIMFSPDLDLDSAIDDRWGIFFWIWRPYMWLVPHRRFWSHSLVVAPLLRLLYFYLVLTALLIGGAWLLGLAGVAVPDYHVRLTEAIFRAFREHPGTVRLFLLGFITGSAAHTVADWLVTGGKRHLRALGVRVRRDYTDHDRWLPRERRP